MSAPVPSPFSRPATATVPGLVSVPTANGLSVAGGVLAMALAATGVNGAMTGAQFDKLATYPSIYVAPAITSVSVGNGLNLTGGVLSMSAPAVSGVSASNGLSLSGGNVTLAAANNTTSAGAVTTGAQTFGGAKTFSSKAVFSAGLTASLVDTTSTMALVSALGASASDVALKTGFSTADGSVNAAAKLQSWVTGYGGTEVEKAFMTKNGALTVSSINAINDGAGPSVVPHFIRGQAGISVPFFMVANSGNTTLLSLDINGALNCFYGQINTGTSFESTSSSGGVYLRSPNNSRWFVSVTNAGALTVASA